MDFKLPSDKFRIKVCKNIETGETHYWAQYTKWYYLGWKDIYNRGFLALPTAQQDIEIKRGITGKIEETYLYETRKEY